MSQRETNSGDTEDESRTLTSRPSDSWIKYEQHLVWTYFWNKVLQKKNNMSGESVDDPPLHLHPVGLWTKTPAPLLFTIASLFVWLSAHFLFSPAAPPPFPSYPVIKQKLPSFVSASCHSVFSSPRCSHSVYLTGDPTVGPGLNLRWTQWIQLTQLCRQRNISAPLKQKTQRDDFTLIKYTCRPSRTQNPPAERKPPITAEQKHPICHDLPVCLFITFRFMLSFCFNDCYIDSITRALTILMFSVLIIELEPFLHCQAIKVLFRRGWSLYQAECLH